MSKGKPSPRPARSNAVARSEMGKLMHSKVSKTVQMKEQTKKGAKRN